MVTSLKEIIENGQGEKSGLSCRDSSLRSERLRCTSSWFAGSKDAREEEVGWLLDWESPLSPLSNVSTPRCTFLSCHWAWAPRLAAWKCNGPLPSDKRERESERDLFKAYPSTPSTTQVTSCRNAWECWNRSVIAQRGVWLTDSKHLAPEAARDFLDKISFRSTETFPKNVRLCLDVKSCLIKDNWYQ